MSKFLPDDYGTPNPFEEAHKRVVTEATRAISRAVTGWAAQVGMTVERWLEVYEPHIEIVPGETPTTITFRVTAHMKGTEQFVLRVPA